jgi:CRISPR/Cas system CSM-associated protein Csm3 (group 7 of RAMP superfamily)
MARSIAQRIKVKGTLVTLSPLHIGGMSLDPTIDLTLAVDGRGRYYIPGTSLAGALRQWMLSNFSLETVKRLWGYQDKDKGHASFFMIEDAYFDQIRVEARDGVGIDRYSGTAADKAKFDRAIIPKGASCNLEMSLDIKEVAAEANYLDKLLSALCNKEIRLGASKTRGLGKIKLHECQTLVQDFTNKDAIIAVLKGIDRPKYDPFESESSQANSAQLKIEIGWEPVGAVMVKDAIEGNVVDILPLMSADKNGLTLVIPGSSIKGALRSQAERIMRTVIGSSNSRQTENATEQPKFLDQVEVPIVQNLFGAAAKKDIKNFGQGALTVEDCYAKSNSMAVTDWQEVVGATTEGELIAALSNAGLASVQQGFHVAIDRWTGGAAEHMLYSNLEPFGISWSNIELVVDFSHLQEHKLAAIALLFLVLRDLHQNRIPIGYGVNRGLGAIKVKSIEMRCRNLNNELSELEDFDLSISSKGAFEGVEDNVLTQINNAWAEAINKIKEDKNND